MRAIVISMLIAAAIGACGYKGPLYLPKPKPAVQQQAPTTAPDEKNDDAARQ